jgi:agmatine deiminase
MTTTSSPPGGSRVPAEWARHDGTIMCWPERDAIWGSHRRRAVEDHATIARTIARFEPVTVVASPARAEEAAQACGGSVEVVEIPIDDSWARDSGPLQAIAADGSRVVVDVTFNGWGAKFAPYDQDALLARRWADRRGEAVLDVDLVLEGGAVSVDGQGTVITTEQCLLHPNRNPTLSRAEIERRVGAALGTTTTVWIPHGLVLDHDTDGHVDNVAAFLDAGLVLAQGCHDDAEPDHDRLAVNLRCLQDAPDARGEPLRAVEVPVLPFTELDGERLVVPYLNLYLCNDGAVVPVCGHPADEDMVALIAEHLPGRTVVPVPGAVLALGGGGPHCITQQIPSLPDGGGAAPDRVATGTSGAAGGLG